MKELTKVFKVLANERRLKILKTLLEENELSVTEISERISLSYKSTSKHLVLLERAGFLKDRMVSLNSYYSINNLEGLKQKLLDMVDSKKY